MLHPEGIHVTMKVDNEVFLSLQELYLEQPKSQEQGEEDQDDPGRVGDLMQAIGYEFHDPGLLQRALTHHSCEEASCPSFERLAFIGDAILNFMIAKEQYSSYPGLDPGKLTRLRAVNVDTEKLARVALKYELYKYLRHNIVLLPAQIEQFMYAIKEYPLHSSGLIDAPKVLADIVESLLGAVYVDSNYSMDITWKVAKRMLEPMISPETMPVHPVTLLHETCQKMRFTLRMRDLWRESGEIEFVVDDRFLGRAKYSAKRIVAKNRAALDAYNQIVQNVVVE